MPDSFDPTPYAPRPLAQGALSSAQTAPQAPVGGLSAPPPPRTPAGPQFAPTANYGALGGMPAPAPTRPTGLMPSEGVINRVLEAIRRGTRAEQSRSGAMASIEQLLEQAGLSRSASRSAGTEQAGFPTEQVASPAFAMGGPFMTDVTAQDYGHGNFVPLDGAGDGRSDHVEARLSPGEFVMDGETVALLGNGNSEAGARKLEEMRQNIRRHKGGALSRGKFSPDAKDPMEYL